MRVHRWWLALLAALLTPWIHIDRYLPIGWLLLQAHAEAPDAGFWVMAGGLLGVVYVTWLVLLSGLAAWLAHRRRDRGRSSGHA